MHIFRWDRAKTFFEHTFQTNFLFIQEKSFFEKMFEIFLVEIFFFQLFLWAGGFFFLEKKIVLKSSETYAQKMLWSALFEGLSK